MPTRDEVLRDLVQTTKEIQARLDRIESAEGRDPWVKDFDLAGTDKASHGAITALAEQEHAPIVPPDDWEEWSEDQRAAWLRTAADKGQPGPVAPEPEWETIELPGGLGAKFPKPSDEAYDAWKVQAPAITENITPDVERGTTLAPDAAAEAYVVGGPLWLAAYDHEFLMGLPYGWRQDMVMQVSWYAPAAAAELGRDILRASTESARGFALPQALDQSDL